MGSAVKSKGKKTKKKAKKAEKALSQDKYTLYQDAVQEPEADVEFFDKTFRKEFKRLPKSLREDFCGTAWLSCTWVETRKDNVAVGVDLDPEPLAWGREHNVVKLKESQIQRLNLVEGNSLDVMSPKVDVVAALNFSYFCFKEKEVLRQYFQAAYDNLEPEGMFIIDIEGGTETMDIHEETRKEKGYTYVWEQEYFDGITHETQCHIHFRFRDGSALEKAFSYEWRLWSLPEVRDMMREVGFERADVYWEGTDKKGDGNGIFTKEENAENCESWIAYVVGVKR